MSWSDLELRERRATLRLAPALPIDEPAEIARIADALEKSFRMHVEPGYVKSPAAPISAIRFYWAGTEIEPWVPSDVWCDGWLSHRYEETPDRNVLVHGAANFHACGGFDLGPIGELLLAAEDDDARKLLVLGSIDLVESALAIAVQTPAFARIPKLDPFEFFATPGHDEPSVRLDPLRSVRL